MVTSDISANRADGTRKVGGTIRSQYLLLPSTKIACIYMDVMGLLPAQLGVADAGMGAICCGTILFQEQFVHTQQYTTDNRETRTAPTALLCYSK